MKQLFLFLALTLSNLLIVEKSNCQAPQKFNYQGIARDIKGNPLSKQSLALKLSVLPTSDATVPEYEETQLVTTNEFGLYTLQIGNGTAITGDMKTVKWETGNKYIKVGIDPTGGNNYVDAGTSQLLSVPYALYADKAGETKVGGSDKPTRATNNYIEKTNGAGVANSNSQLFDNGTNIGMGTTTPQAKIHMNAATTNELRIQSAGGSPRLSFFGDNATTFTSTANYALMYKRPATDVGNYSTGFPNAKLFIFGNAQGGLLFNTGGNVGFGYFNQAANTTTTNLFVEGTTGNTGIGTASPGAKLEVAGQVKITGGVPGVGKVLTSDGTGLASWAVPSIKSVGGTTNYIPKYTPDGITLGNSALKDSNTYGLIYNANALPGINHNYYYKIPVGSANYNSFYNIHQPNSFHNYITLSNNTTSGGYLGTLLGDSSNINGWFNGLNSAAGDSVGAFYKVGYGSNQLFMGSANTKGLYLQLKTGKMGNNTFGSNAHFAINSSYDTAAHFVSDNANNTENYGVITEANSDQTPFGLQAFSTFTGTGNASYNYGVRSSVSGVTQDSRGFDANVYNSTGGYVTGLNASITQDGTGSSYGALLGVSNNTNNNALTRGIQLNASAPSTSLGNVMGIEAYASGGDGTVIGVKGSATGHYDATNFSNDPIGIYGEAFGGSGSSNYAYSIYGATATGAFFGNYAGYFNGNTHVNGALSKLSGTFKIDHPQDPANKFLVHSFVESPDMMNVYNGNAMTDANGNAVVSLPSYFEAENKDFKYQLTVIDNSNDFVMAKITNEVANNSFGIKTSKPNVKVSWQVTGVRQDAWANANRVVAEVEKGDREKGKYLTPELFGKDDSYALNPQPKSTKMEISEKDKAQKAKDLEFLKSMPSRAKEMAAQRKAHEQKAKENSGSSGSIK